MNNELIDNIYLSDIIILMLITIRRNDKNNISSSTVPNTYKYTHLLRLTNTGFYY